MWKLLLRAGKLFTYVSVCMFSIRLLFIKCVLYCSENTLRRGKMEHLRESPCASRGVPFIFTIIEAPAHRHTINTRL